MTLKQTLKIAAKSILAYRSRSLLTILGIVIGIASIILVTSISAGGAELILKQVRALGSKTMVIQPGQDPKGPADFSELFTDSIKERDYFFLNKEKKALDLSVVAPAIFETLSIQKDNNFYRSNVIGTTAEMPQILNVSPDFGFIFSDEDVRAKAAYAVIGDEVREKLFPDSEALGQKIKIKGKNFKVIGIFAKKGQVGFLNLDKTILVPYTTGMSYLFGRNYFNQIILEAKDEKVVPSLAEDLKEVMRNLHDLKTADKDDFHIETQQEALDRVGMITDILTALLLAVAAISLVVGGIGIMNIMLVSVTERTKEIGLRKALGATNADITLQFLIEAVLLTTVGGLAGILLGGGLSFLLSIILSFFMELDWQFIFPYVGAVIGFVVSAGIGLIFGLYPARQAAAKNPIEALRYE